MPAYEYSLKQKAFVKVCSCCKTAFVGNTSVDESLVIFQADFGISNGKAQTADGLQSRCRMCNTRSRRELGITRSIIEEMFLAQNGKCDICTKDISIEKGAPADIHAHVDHDTTTGKVRALLCGGCNRGIGIFQHSPDILRRAVAYLEKHQVIPFRRRVI